MNDNEIMNDDEINNVIEKITERYKKVNDITNERYKNEETFIKVSVPDYLNGPIFVRYKTDFISLVKDCYVKLLEKSTKVNTQNLPAGIPVSSQENINSNNIQVATSKLYYDESTKEMNFYINSVVRNGSISRISLPISIFKELVIDTIFTWICRLLNQNFQLGFFDNNLNVTDNEKLWGNLINEMYVIIINYDDEESGILKRIMALSQLPNYNENNDSLSRGGTRKRKRKMNTRKKTTKNSRNKRHKRHKRK
jgi:hypothetical protein